VKVIESLAVLALALSGCVAQGPQQPTASAGSTWTPAQKSPFDTPDPATPSLPDLSPRLILPVTGGPPVIGIPLGGSLFLRVTGGPPVIGIPE
jgi:hypothetical protein